MMQELKTFRDFLKEDTKAQFAFMPLQIENCMLLKSLEKDEKGVSHIVLHVFDAQTTYIGTIEKPHWIPNKKS